MKLIDFLNSSPNNPYSFQNNYIDLIKMQTLFSKLAEKYPKRIINIQLNYSDNIIDTIKGILSSAKQNNKDNSNDNFIILSINPDCDFPPPKMEIFKYQDFKLNNIENQKKQIELDNMMYINKININRIDEIPLEIKHIFCHSLGYLNNRYNMIPLGRDFKNINYFNYIDTLPKVNKTIICYYNCTLPPNQIHWYGMIRKNIYNMIIENKQKFIEIEYCNVGPRIYNNKTIINY